jgi:hypothetical protein
MAGRAPSLWFRGAVWLLLLGLSVPLFTRSMMELGNNTGILHGPNLIFHEAGHVLFGFFGNRLLTAFGGSLMQTLVPLAFMVSFLWRGRDLFGAAAMCWWAGENLVDVAPYINDARMLQLTLLGGHTGREVEGHDWEFILTQLNMLDFDIYLSRAVLATGRLWMAVALAWALGLIVLQIRARVGAPPEVR